MATKRFEKRLHILVSEAEYVMLSQLAERDGFTPSDAVRQLIRRRHAEVFGERVEQPQPTKARKRK